jgi:hypothetical protein
MSLSKFKGRIITAIKEGEVRAYAVDEQLAYNKDTKITLGFT